MLEPPGILNYQSVKILRCFLKFEADLSAEALAKAGNQQGIWII